MTTSHKISISEALGLDELSDDEREEIMLDFTDLIFRSSLLRLLERMDEPTKVAFGALVDRDASLEELQVFIQERVPDADSAVEETVREITDDILAVTTSR